MRSAWLAPPLLIGCAVGVGPYQPGRMKVSGYASKRNLEPIDDYGGGTTQPYYVDSSFYAGIKLGASWTRIGEPSYLGTGYFETTAGFGTSLADDRVVLQTNLVYAQYGWEKSDVSNFEGYYAFGGELVGKLKLTPRIALKAGPALTYGKVTKRDMMGEDKDNGVAGVRGVVGLDLAWWHFAVRSKYSSNDVVLSVEYHRVRTNGAAIRGGDDHLDGHALAFSLTLAAF